MKKKFWEFKNYIPNETADLYIYNEISSWEDEDVTSANSFKKDLDELGNVKYINLYINSPGGSVADGLAIASMLKRHKAFVTAHVDSMACSIASVITCACDKVIMPSNTMLMVHNALIGGFFFGNAKDFRKQADDLDKITESLRQTYLDKAGDKLTEEKLIELMDAESWLTAKECFDLGLCDEIVESKRMVAKCDTKVFSNFVNVPDSIKALLNKEENSMEDVVQDVVEVVEDEVTDEAAETIENISDDAVETEVVDTTEEVIDEVVEDESNEEVETVEEEVEATEDAPVSEEVVDEADNRIAELEAKIEVLAAEKAEIQNKLDEANVKVIELNNKITELTPIVDKYNAELAEKKAIEDSKKLEETREFYKNKFDQVGARSKFESEEVQNLISNCIKDEAAVSKLNLMLVDMIQVPAEKVVTNRIESISKIENLIPMEESINSKYGFR